MFGEHPPRWSALWLFICCIFVRPWCLCGYFWCVYKYSWAAVSGFNLPTITCILGSKIQENMLYIEGWLAGMHQTLQASSSYTNRGCRNFRLLTPLNLDTDVFVFSPAHLQHPTGWEYSLTQVEGLGMAQWMEWSTLTARQDVESLCYVLLHTQHLNLQAPCCVGHSPWILAHSTAI